MLRTGMLDVDVRGECVGRCAGVWCVSVFVARVEGARVSPDMCRSCGAGWSSGAIPTLCLSLLLETPYNRNRWHVVHSVRCMFRLGAREARLPRKYFSTSKDMDVTKREGNAFNSEMRQEVVW